MFPVRFFQDLARTPLLPFLVILCTLAVVFAAVDVLALNFWLGASLNDASYGLAPALVFGLLLPLAASPFILWLAAKTAGHWRRAEKA